MKSVTIGERYWQTAKNDYADIATAWVREACQNAVDAGSTNIIFTAEKEYDGENFFSKVCCKDDGCGMSKETLEEKFLALGESGKEHVGTVGGFGVAKTILCFCHPKWEIKSHDYICKGRFGKYEIYKSRTHRKGMELTVWIDIIDANWDKLEAAAMEWIGNSKVNPMFKVNGKSVRTAGEETVVRKYEWGTLGEYGDHPTYIFIRLNGQFMCKRHLDIDKSLVFDLEGESQTFLNTNRDSLKCNYRNKLDHLIAIIYRDPDKVFELEKPILKVWKLSDALRGIGKGLTRLKEKLSNIYPEPENEWTQEKIKHAIENHVAANGNVPQEFEDECEYFEGAAKFALANFTTSDIPHELIPQTMTMEMEILYQEWKDAVKNVLRILGIEEENKYWGFAVTTKDSNRARYYRNSNGEDFYLLVPTTISPSGERTDWEPVNREELISIAVHEVCHTHAWYHSELWASKYTEAAGKVFYAYREGDWEI